jgi:hypothetical protein
MESRYSFHEKLLQNIKDNMQKLEDLKEETDKDYVYGDAVYRFYHHSFKVYYIQTITLKIVDTLKPLGHEKLGINPIFENIFKEGTGKKWEPKHNREWGKHTRPMLEAFFHARYFLEMAIKFGRELEKAPEVLPFGWAGLLYFYNLR